MTVAFKDGTTLTFPDGPQAESVLQFDLPWLVYVHGTVTTLNKQDGSSSFAVAPSHSKNKSMPCCQAA